MNFGDYQKWTAKTAIYPGKGEFLGKVYTITGMLGEAGEVAEKFKKQIRDKDGKFDDEFVEALKGELGDVLWYIAAIATEFGLNLQNVVEHNCEKLESRMQRGKLGGSGDNR